MIYDNDSAAAGYILFPFFLSPFRFAFPLPFAFLAPLHPNFLSYPHPIPFHPTPGSPSVLAAGFHRR